MTRLIDLPDVLFPVDLRPILADIPDSFGDRLVPVPNRKAIVNLSTSQVLGIVSRDYRLVTNHEALEMAYECCIAVFPETKPIEWQVTAVDAPMTGGHCCIDLQHNSTALDFNAVPAGDRPDVFGPFIRVTNSYNGLRALTFNIGFFRKVCKNGMILAREVIKFRFSHARSEIPEKIEFLVARERLLDLRTDFVSYLSALRKCAVPRRDFEPIICGVLHFVKPHLEHASPNQVSDWTDLTAQLAGMSDRYAAALGETAYAVFNVITEFASNPAHNRCVHRDRDSLQRLAGTWLNGFSQKCSNPGFHLDDYMTTLTNAAAA